MLIIHDIAEQAMGLPIISVLLYNLSTSHKIHTIHCHRKRKDVINGFNHGSRNGYCDELMSRTKEPYIETNHVTKRSFIQQTVRCVIIKFHNFSR